MSTPTLDPTQAEVDAARTERQNDAVLHTNKEEKRCTKAYAAACKRKGDAVATPRQKNEANIVRFALIGKLFWQPAGEVKEGDAERDDGKRDDGDDGKRDDKAPGADRYPWNPDTLDATPLTVELCSTGAQREHDMRRLNARRYKTSLLEEPKPCRSLEQRGMVNRIVNGTVRTLRRNAESRNEANVLALAFVKAYNETGVKFTMEPAGEGLANVAYSAPFPQLGRVTHTDAAYRARKAVRRAALDDEPCFPSYAAIRAKMDGLVLQVVVETAKGPLESICKHAPGLQPDLDVFLCERMSAIVKINGGGQAERAFVVNAQSKLLKHLEQRRVARTTVLAAPTGAQATDILRSVRSGANPYMTPWFSGNVVLDNDGSDMELPVSVHFDIHDSTQPHNVRSIVARGNEDELEALLPKSDALYGVVHGVAPGPTVAGAAGAATAGAGSGDGSGDPVIEPTLRELADAIRALVEGDPAYDAEDTAVVNGMQNLDTLVALTMKHGPPQSP